MDGAIWKGMMMGRSIGGGVRVIGVRLRVTCRIVGVGLG